MEAVLKYEADHDAVVEHVKREGLEQGLEQGLERRLEQGEKRGLAKGRAEGLEQGEERKEANIIYLLFNSSMEKPEIADRLKMDFDEVDQALKYHENLEEGE